MELTSSSTEVPDNTGLVLGVGPYNTGRAEEKKVNGSKHVSAFPNAFCFV